MDPANSRFGLLFSCPVLHPGEQRGSCRSEGIINGGN